MQNEGDLGILGMVWVHPIFRTFPWQRGSIGHLSLRPGVAAVRMPGVAASGGETDPEGAREAERGQVRAQVGRNCR